MTADGTLERKGDRVVVRFERRIAHPIDVVWDAITNPERMVQWWARVEGEPREGADIVLTWLNTGPDGEQAVMHCHVTRFEPPHTFELEGDIHGRLVWELEEDGDGTILRLTNELSPPEERFVPMSMAGWDIHLDHLEAALDGRPVNWATWSEDHMPAWQEKHDLYAAAR
jgi:uncharacterized protein YndB with AHSA1/START domain